MNKATFGLVAALAAGTAAAEIAKPTMGCAWYPEAWPQERRATDLDLMQKAGIDSVRIGEFNWANFEPREGAFDFRDFKRVLDELAKRKMTALLCTATAAPPRWFFAKYPEAWKLTDAGGKRMPIEHRRQYCVNNPDFRRCARALTAAQVAAFAGHPAIRAWQIDNELSSDAEGGHCTCRHCTVAFRAWLKRTYGTLENLNRAWNGAFWSNAVQDWDQITPPFVTMIPVFRFDYTRFQSDAFQAFAEEQAAIIRAKDSRPICYNSWMSWQGDFDLAKFTKKMDFVACDTYLGQDFMQIYRAAWDLYRGLKRRPFTVAETGPFNSITARDNATDFLRPAYWEMFAHGADAVYWFRWRRSVMGEEACRSIVQHDGRPGRSYDVISNVRRELLDVLKRTGDLPLPENRIAVLFNSWDVQLGRSEDRNIPPYGATMRHYAAIRSTGLGVDVVPIAPEADLSKYALVVIPRCEHLPDDFAKKLRDYVKKGGVIHAGARLNVRGDSSAYRTDPVPYGLTDLFGLSIREYCSVCTRDGESFATYKPARDVADGAFKGTVAGGTATFDREMEDVTLEGARAVEKFPGGLYKGAPLYMKNNYGTGSAFYQAASVDFETEKRLLRHAFEAAGLKPVADLPDEVSRVRRGNIVIYTNVREEPQTFKTTDTGTALLGPAPANGELTLPAYGVTVARVSSAGMCHSPTALGDGEQARSAVAFRGEELLVDGKPFLIRGGEIHPQRVPREYWRHRIRMMKAMGLNAVSSYFFWNDFERADGSFDFTTGCRDVAAFLRLCNDEGMKVLFRPGPYCCGEWDFGGLPSRLLAKEGYLVRTTKNPDYLKACERYLTAICDVARPFLWQNGGPIILTQIENEYGSWRADDRTPGLVPWTKDLLKRLGFGPFYMADGVGDYFYRNLPYPDPEIAVGMDPGMNEEDWNAARKINPGVPVFSSETYPGWLRHWGEANWRATDLTTNVAWFVKTKKSFCFFVAHGGTSFGFTAGANEERGAFSTDMTSYDYGAPITEQGRVTPEYHRYRNILAAEVGGVQNLPPVPDPIPTMAIAAFTPAFFAPLTANCGKPFKSETCVHFESFGQNQGLAVYETELPAGEASELKFTRLADYAKVLVGGKLVATLDRRLNPRACMIPKREKRIRLTLIVEAMGHVNFDVGMEHDRKGISGPVTLGGAELRNWTISPKPLSENAVADARRCEPVDGVPGGHFRGTFELKKTADTFIDMSKWSKGTLFVNGRNLGRYWKIGPQFSLYCPASWLKEGQNTVDVFDMDLAEAQPIGGVRENIVRENVRTTRNASVTSNSQPATHNPQPTTRNSQPHNPQLTTRNSQPATHNPQLTTPLRAVASHR